VVVCADTENPTLTENFICGASAGVIAMTLVYPMYVALNRLVSWCFCGGL